jgi:hypothetical protein
MKWIGQNIYDLVSKFRNTVDFSKDVTFYQPVNDANPKISIGASDEERLRIMVNYQGTTTTSAQEINFRSYTESATANDGMFGFNVDGTSILYIDDGGINFLANKGISINGTDILTDSSGTATLSNIDALDATTIATIEAAIESNIDTITNDLTISTTGTQLKLAHNENDYATFTVADTGDLTIATVGDGTRDSDLILDADGDIKLAPSGNLTIDADNIAISSSTSAKPYITLTATHTDKDKSAEIRFVKDAADTEDGENLGEIAFYGEDEGNNQTKFAGITAEISESDESDEAGKLTLFVTESDGTTASSAPGLILEGEHATDGEVDVTIANGAASTTIISGTLTMGSTATIDNSGVWVGGVIPSAKLDTDTAHLTTDQTFTGVKTFNQAINKKALHFLYTANKFTGSTANETYFSLGDADRDLGKNSEDGVGIVGIVPCDGVLKHVVMNCSANLSSLTWEFRVYRVPSGTAYNHEILMATVASNAGAAANTNKVVSFVSATADTNVITYETGYNATTMFTAGDRVLLSLESNSDASGNPKINATLCFELDESTI